MRVSRATGVLGGVKIDKNKTEAIFDGITAKELCVFLTRAWLVDRLYRRAGLCDM